MRSADDAPNQEIEHKFLLKDPEAVESIVADSDGNVEGIGIAQGYLLPEEAPTELSLRLIPSDGIYQLRHKSRTVVVDGSPVRSEDEWPLHDRTAGDRSKADEAEDRRKVERLLDACGDAVVSKTRYPILAVDGFVWTIDVFHDLNEGLVLAEIELPAAGVDFDLPDWCGEDVSDDHRYYNRFLAYHPYTTW